MKAYIRILLNIISVTLAMAALVLFSVYLLYTSDIRGRCSVLQRETVMFVVSMIDDRVEPLSGAEHAPAPARIGDLAASVAGYYDLNDRVHLAVFTLGPAASESGRDEGRANGAAGADVSASESGETAAAGELLYPDRPGPAWGSIREAALERARMSPEGMVSFDGGFGYYFGSRPLGVGILAWSADDEVFQTRDLVLYGLGGAFTLFAGFVLLILLGLVRRWRGVRSRLIKSFTPVLEGDAQVPGPVEDSPELESAGFLGVYNRLVEQLRKRAAGREEKIGRLVSQSNKLQRILLLHRKYLPQETLQRLSESRLGDLASSRRTVVSLTVELVGYLGPSKALYPQTITNELQNLHAFLKSSASKNGGIVNHTRGYRINLVYGVHGDDSSPAEALFRSAVLLFEQLSAWVEERNRSEMNVSGVNWLVRAGLARGEAVAGVVGDGYLVIGAPVEESERLLEEAKRFQVPLVSSDKESLGNGSLRSRMLDQIEEEAGDGRIPLFEVFTVMQRQLDQAITLYEHGLDMFYEGRYDMAVQDFKKVVVLFDGDVPSEMFLERCAEKMRRKS